MNIKDEIVKCCICGKEVRISEVAKAYVKKGKSVYICVGCHSKV